MKYVLLLIAFFWSIAVYSQPKLIKKENRTLRFYEEYYVLKSDTLIKEGKYTKRNSYDNKPVFEGAYKNDLKEGVWLYYSYAGNVVDSGRFEQGKKVGAWTAKFNNGDDQVRYDYTSEKLLYFKIDPLIDKGAIYNIIDGPNKTFSILDRPPIYLDGDALFNYTIGNYINYPAKARAATIQGRVIIRFLIDKDGNASNYNVIKSIGYDCDEEALRVIKLNDGKWAPGILNGNPVSVEKDVTVRFQLGQVIR